MREHTCTITLCHTRERGVSSRVFGCGMVKHQRVRSTEKLRHQSCILGYAYSPHLMVLSGGGGSISVTPGLSLPLLREDEVIWLIGNLEKTNKCDWLSPSVISSWGATRGHGSGDGLWKGGARAGGCHGPGCVKGVLYWSYLLTDASYIFSIGLGKVRWPPALLLCSSIGSSQAGRRALSLRTLHRP